MGNGTHRPTSWTRAWRALVAVAIAAIGLVVPATAASADGGTFTVTIGASPTPILSGEAAVYTGTYSCSGVADSSCDGPIVFVEATCAHATGTPDCIESITTGANPDFLSTGEAGAYRALRALSAGESGVFTITVTTKNLVTPNGTILTTTLRGATMDEPPSTSATAAPVRIDATPRLVADKLVSPSNPAIGGTADYTIRYSAADAVYWASPPGTVGHVPESVRVVDPLPAGAEFVSATDGGTYDETTRTVTWAPAPHFPSSTSGQMSVKVRFPASAFRAGDEVTNDATVSSYPIGGTEADRITVPVSVTHSLSAPVYGRMLLKEVYTTIGRSMTNQFNALATRGDLASWSPYLVNNSNVDVDLRLIDPIQPGILVRDVTYNGHRLLLTYTDGTTDSFEKADPTTQATVTVPAGKTVARIESFRDGAAPGQNLSLSIRSIVGLGGESTIRNCADSIGSVDGAEVWNTTTGGGAACTGIVVIDPRPIPAATLWAMSGTRLPGSVAVWSATVRNAANPTGDPTIDDLAVLTSPWAAITLEPGHTYVPGSIPCSTTGECTVDVRTEGLNQIVRVTWPDRELPASTTPEDRMIQFQFRTLVGPDASNQVRAQLQFGDLDHPFVVSTPICCEYPTRAGHRADTTDVNENAVADEYLAWSPATTPVQVAGTLAATKRVLGDRDAAIVTAPGTGKAAAGGTASYQVTLTNTSAQAASSIVLYDVLPAVGDTGVIDSQAGTARGSQFPVTLTGAPTTTAGGTPQFAYSTSANPCRPEVGVNTDCTDDWSTATPADWSAVRAVRATLTDTTLATGQSVALTVPVAVPADAAVGTIAYNSVGYAARVGNAPLVAEPVRIGLQVDGSAVSITTFAQTTFDANDAATAPTVSAGEPVRWTFEVANTGTTTLTDVTVTAPGVDPATIDCGRGSNTVASLAAGTKVTCTATGTATVGRQAIDGTVDATSNDGPLHATDPAGYLGIRPALTVVKSTQGRDANTAAEGPMVLVGGPVRWTYVVTNTGTVALTDVAVGDSVEDGIDCGDGTATIATLAIDTSVTCTLDGIAVAGPYANTGTASAAPIAVVDVNGESTTVTATDDDPSHYTGIAPAITVTKLIDGTPVADAASAPVYEIGSTVTVTFVVRNSGTAPITDLVVVDDDLGTISCPATTLAVGEEITCTTTTTATAGTSGGGVTATGTATGFVGVDGAERSEQVEGPSTGWYAGEAPTTTTAPPVTTTTAPVTTTEPSTPTTEPGTTTSTTEATTTTVGTEIEGETVDSTTTTAASTSTTGGGASGGGATQQTTATSTTTATATRSGSLARTGATVGPLATSGLVLLGLGGVLLAVRRRITAA
jgi:uncharacterized repeat protein (TIGR01451 family)